MRRIISTVMIIVLSVGTSNIYRNVVEEEIIAETIEGKKSYIAIANSNKLEERIEDIDEKYIKDVEDHKNIYMFNASMEEAEIINSYKNVYVSEDVEVEACGYNVEGELADDKTEWNMELINNKDNYIKDGSCNGINIAIIDSGIDFSSDINVVDVIDFVDEGNELNIFSDMTGHGTSIAGVIASSGETEKIEGINSNVNIYSARVLDENNSAPISRIVKGIYWAIDKKVKIISISFGTREDNEVLKKAINDAINEGILVVAAAGNTSDEVLYPAAYKEVLAVGSVDSKGQISDFSANDKSKIDVMAPGENIKTIGAFNGSIIVTGTSISVPHVVGAASLLWIKDKKVSADFIKELIITSSNETNIKKSKKGIIDIDYAFEIYDDFKVLYEKNKITSKYIDEEFVNDNKIKKCTNDYVEGVWNLDGHKVCAEYAGKFMELTADQIKILKKSVIYPDQTFSGMVENPQWHTKQIKNYYDYISCYRCAVLVAKALQNGKKVTTVKKPNDMDELGYKKMLDQVASIKWSKDLLCGCNVTNKNKGLFGVGMAIHVITDSFAHQAYMKKDGKWKHLVHNGNNPDTCDNYAYPEYKNRFQCAKDAACGTLFSYTYSNNSSGYFDYIRFTECKDFKLCRFKEYLLKQDNLNKNDLNLFKDDIDKINIDY